MTDHVGSQRRSKIMASIGTKDTKPEMIVRRSLHRLGFRYRLHSRELPGSPDLVFPALKKVVFVHGCFWHGHDCRWGKLPKSNTTYWQKKIQTNRKRDIRNLVDLRALGWGAYTIWQCELREKEKAIERIVEFLGSE